MNTRFLLSALLSLSGLSLLSPELSGAFVSFDNFNSYAVGALNGQGPVGNTWTAQAGGTVVNQAGADNAAQMNNNAIPNYRSLATPGLSILNTNAAATVYWNFTLGGVLQADNNWNFVVTDVATPTDTAGTSEVQFNYDIGSGTTFRARNGAAFKFLSTDGAATGRLVPVAGVAYNAWFEINNVTDTYKVFLQSPSLPGITTRTQMFADDGTGGVFTFRNSAGGPQANDLITANMGNGNTGAGVQFDDIWVDLAGFNSANPVPEPASAVFFGGLGLLGIFRRRRS